MKPNVMVTLAAMMLLATSSAGIEAAGRGAPGRDLAIQALSYSTSGQREGTIEVLVTAGDRQGIERIDVELDGERASIAGRGQKLVTGRTIMRLHDAGTHELHAAAIARDGIRRGPVESRPVLMEHATREVEPRDGVPDVLDRLEDVDYVASVMSAEPKIPLVAEGRPWWIRWEEKKGQKQYAFD